MRRFPFLVPCLVLGMMLPCAFVRPSSAGELGTTVTLCSDGTGNAGWIRMDRVDGRMRATPYLRISGETSHEVLNAARRTGMIRSASVETDREHDPRIREHRKEMNKKTLSSLLAGPNGVSLGAVLDLARQTSEAARSAFRKSRSGDAPSLTADARPSSCSWRFAIHPWRLAETEPLFPQSNAIPSGTGVRHDPGQNVHFAIADFSHDE